ncbi:hypothetical protein ACIQZB_32630 [Streptomyces sp. NPDC097727]|uniref:hypothetical protein n=1 Tax=Streptomyces sp. NPDC097727 TaxID=3366092 RepID=UPI003803FEA6
MSEENLPEIVQGVERSVRVFTAAEFALAEAEQRVSQARESVLERVGHLRAAVEAVRDPELIRVLRHLH